VVVVLAVRQLPGPGEGVQPLEQQLLGEELVDDDVGERLGGLILRGKPLAVVRETVEGGLAVQRVHFSLRLRGRWGIVQAGFKPTLTGNPATSPYPFSCTFTGPNGFVIVSAGVPERRVRTGLRPRS